MSLKKTSLSAMMAAHIAAVTANPRPRFEPLPAGAFPAPSLSAWLSAAHAANVPAVPSDEVARFAVTDLLGFEQDTPTTQAMFERLRALHQDLPPGSMLRWDCCAPMGIKWHVGEGHPDCPTDPATLELHPGDPRAFDILYAFPADEVAVHRRPWVPAAVHEAFPVEFRVFVQNAQVVAVSNYYVQRALPATVTIRIQARAAATAAARIVAKLRDEGRFPWMDGQTLNANGEPPSFDATLDFLVTPQGDVLFLEAGPGFGLGAHPCCFYNPATKTVRPLEGILLKVGGRPLPLNRHAR